MNVWNYEDCAGSVDYYVRSIVLFHYIPAIGFEPLCMTSESYMDLSSWVIFLCKSIEFGTVESAWNVVDKIGHIVCSSKIGIGTRVCGETLLQKDFQGNSGLCLFPFIFFIRGICYPSLYFISFHICQFVSLMEMVLEIGNKDQFEHFPEKNQERQKRNIDIDM